MSLINAAGVIVFSKVGEGGFLVERGRREVRREMQLL
jgi:hypothetical protein